MSRREQLQGDSRLQTGRRRALVVLKKREMWADVSNSRVTQGYRQEDGELLWFQRSGRCEPMWATPGWRKVTDRKMESSCGLKKQEKRADVSNTCDSKLQTGKIMSSCGFKEAGDVSLREQRQGDSRLQTGRRRAHVAFKKREMWADVSNARVTQGYRQEDGELSWLWKQRRGEKERESRCEQCQGDVRLQTGRRRALLALKKR